jgi:hypothetical protein
MDIIPDPDMLVSALAGCASDDGSRKQVRAKRSELERAMTLKKTSELSQTRQIVTVRHVGQELLVLYNDWGHFKTPGYSTSVCCGWNLPQEKNGIKYPPLLISK